jgi:transcriptional regulator with XRE-family HTH domain
LAKSSNGYAYIAMNESQPTEIFKERLKKARETRGFSSGELAEKSGLPASSISHFEAGARKPSFDNLKSLAVALDVTTDFLLGRTDTLDAIAVAGRLHRHLPNLTAENLQLAEDFIEMLAKRGETKGES